MSEFKDWHELTFKEKSLLIEGILWQLVCAGVSILAVLRQQHFIGLLFASVGMMVSWVLFRYTFHIFRRRK